MPPKPNGYFFYMRAMKEDVQAWRNKSMAELSELCSPSWDAMSKEDKQFYDDMKHAWTGVMPKKKKNKSTAVAMGVPLSSQENSKLSKQVDTYGRCLLDVKLAKENALENARLESVDIQNMVSDKNYKTTEFLFLATTNYCVTKRDPVVYCPAEISIGRFNLRKGFLQEEFHAFPKLEVPLGYQLMCLENCKELKMPIDFSMAKSMNEIAEDLRQFDRDTRKSSSGKLVLFSHPEDIKRCIKNLIRIFDVEDVHDLPFKVYSLAELVLHIVKIENVNSTCTKEQLFEQLLPIRRGYESGLGCDWHEANTDYGLCSTRVLRQWILSVCEKLKAVKPSPSYQEDEPADDGIWKQLGGKTGIQGLNVGIGGIHL